ncbi:MAG: hypothetical protein CMJ89_02670 [Planctomycetes bacterium]|jgi:hypothetical protein|nr:hypothetical protein [Planctomycetota bacterium]
MRARWWSGSDVLRISGDGFRDHLAFGLAAIGRLLGPREVAVDGVSGPGPYEEEAWKGRASVKSCSP